MAFLALPAYDPSALEPPPAWQATPALSADDYRERFERTGPNTIGLEEELMLIDPATLSLAPFVEEVLAAFDGDSRFTRELRRAQLELTTAPCHTVGESCEELREARADLVERLAGQVRIAAAGTHPVSTDWGELSEGERYRQLIEEYTWMGLHGLPCGLHVHVAVGGAERTLAVYNAMRSYLPEIGALAANSPFLAGQDTGLASIRLKLTEQLARAALRRPRDLRRPRHRPADADPGAPVRAQRGAGPCGAATRLRGRATGRSGLAGGERRRPAALRRRPRRIRRARPLARRGDR